MKSYFRFFLFAFGLFAIPSCANLSRPIPTPTPVPRGSEIRGVFVGNTPCTAQARPLLQIPAEAGCEQMIWNLALRQDLQTGDPTTYSLKSSYGMSRQGSNDLIRGGTSVSLEGKWTIIKGIRNDPDAIVYQINPDDPQRTISFLRINDDLIHILSKDKSMLVGNGAWSYTLDRMDNQSQTQPDPLASSLPQPPTRPPQPPMPANSAVFGVFDGRTPCQEVAMEFTGTTPQPGCVKIKWRLTLYQDNMTGEPNRYLYMSTSAYREGTWKIVRGMDGDPEAVIYELRPDGTQQPFYFLKVDDNNLFMMDEAKKLLVGNEFFSYTLSRTDQGQ